MVTTNMKSSENGFDGCPKQLNHQIPGKTAKMILDLHKHLSVHKPNIFYKTKKRHKRKYDRPIKPDATLVPQGLMDFTIPDDQMDKIGDKFADIATTFAERIEAGISSAQDEFKNTIFQLATSLAGCYILYNITNGCARALWAGFKMAINLLGKAGSGYIIRLVEQHFPSLKGEGLQPQANLPEAGIFENIFSIIIGFFTLKDFNPSSAFKFLMDFRHRNNIRNSLTDWGVVIKNAFHKLKAYLYGNRAEYELGVDSEEFGSWYEACNNFITASIECKIEKREEAWYNTGNFELLNFLLAKGQYFKRLYPATNDQTKTIYLAIDLYMKDLVAIEKSFSKRAFSKNSIRIKPLTLLLIGKSGVGKSAMTVPLLDHILIKTMRTKEEIQLFRQNNMDFIYSRAPETDFWDGYFGQKAVVIDDFLQANLSVTPTASNEAMDLIRGSNIYPYLLHKAHLDDKGNSYLNSRILLCSTNDFNVSSAAIREKEALRRRFDVVGYVYPKQEFSADPSEIDPKKRRLRKDLEFTHDVYEIHVENGPGTDIVSFDEFCKLCVDKYNELEKNGTTYLERVSEMRDKCAEEAIELLDSAIEPQADLPLDFDALLAEANKEIDVMVQPLVDKKEFLSKLMDYTRASVNSVKARVAAKFSTPMWVGLGVAIAAICGIVGLYSIYKNDRGDSGPTEPQSYKPTRHAPVNVRTIDQAIVNATPQADSERVGNNYQSLCRTSLYFIYLDGRPVSSTIFLCGTRCLMNKHVFDHLVERPMKTVEFRQYASVLTGRVRVPPITMLGGDFTTMKHTFCEGGSDLMVVDVHKARDHRDIRDLFITCDEINLMDRNFEATLYRANGSKKEIYKSDVTCAIVQKPDAFFGQLPVVQYPVSTEIGDCGSLVFSCNKKCGYGKILSFHVALESGCGVGLVVPRSLLDSPSIQLQADLQYERKPRPAVGDHSTGLWFVGDVPATKVPGLVRKTKLRRSLLSGWAFEPKKSPAVLKPRDGVDPFELCLLRYSDPNFEPKGQSYILASMLNYSDLICSLPVWSVVEKRLLTYEECVEGIPGDRYINGIPRKTSAGYPWCLKYKNGKKEIFGTDHAYDMTTPGAFEVLESVKTKENLLKEFKRPQFLYMDTMKDELRSKDKVSKLATRMISCCPVDYTILVRRYFGAFASHMMHNRIYSGSAVGINPFSHEWTTLAHYLGGERAMCIAGDFSRFDSTQCSDLLWAVLGIIDIWYSDGYSDIRRILWLDLVNSVHVHGSGIYEFTHCLPSGHPLTSIVNSMYVQLAFRVIWCELHGTPIAIESFDDHVRLVAYGDDHVLSIDQYCVVKGFHFSGIKKLMSTVGLVYTSEDKSDKEYTWKRLEDCTFLKRAFSLDGSYWEAPLDLDTVLEMPMWYRDGPDPIRRQRDNIDNCLNELAIHPPHIFNYYANKLLDSISTFPILLYNNTLHDQSYYRLRCFTSWVDTEILELEDLGGSDNSIAQYLVKGDPNGHVPQANLPPPLAVGNWVIPTAETQPAENNTFVRKDATSQSDLSVTDPQYTAINTTENKVMNTHTATGFLEDAETRVYEPVPITNLDPRRLNTALTSLDRSDVVKILETPIRIRSFNVPSTSAAGTTLDSWVLPFDSTNFSGTGIGQQMWLSRLNAFQAFKAVANLEFKVNCHRFAQGRLLAHFIPGQANDIDMKGHRFNLMTKSQTPNVQINLNRDTSVTFRVPYVSAWPAYDLTKLSYNGFTTTTLETTAGVMGKVFVCVYSPLVGVTNLDVEVYLHFSDVELFNIAYAPQANLQDDEAPKGVVSGPLNTIADASKILTRIPALSSLAGTAEWFTRLASRAASSFGFSAPFNESHCYRANLIQQPYAANSDGDRPCVKLGLSHTAKLDVLPYFASNDLDEMNIEYLCNRTAYYNTVDWTTSDAVGSNVWGLPIRPSVFRTFQTISGVTAQTFAPFTYISNFFSLWRADVVLTFKVIKTEFHTGRLQVAFNPGPNTGMSFAASAYTSRVILDMKESDTFVVKVPFVSVTPMLYTNTATGYLYVDVITPLQCPPTVSSSVDIIIEVSAENVSFAQPTSFIAYPINGDNAAFTPQADLGDNEVAPREKVLVIPGLMSNPDTIGHTRFTCSEAVTSIKQLCNRFCTFSDDFTLANNNLCCVVSPFGIGSTYESGGTYTSTGLRGDYLTAFVPLFALRRGAVRMWFSNRSSADNQLAMGDTPQTNTRSNVSYGSVRPKLNALPLFKTVSGYSDMVEVPQYSVTHSMGCATAWTNTRSLDIGEPSTLIYYRTNTAFSSNFSYMRAAGDDFQLGFFVGVPVMFQDSATTAVF